jgi:hypothetical protein
MKKVVRIFIISLASLLIILISGISIALWIVFTPEKITPLVRKQAANYLTCRYEIGKVEPTFFSSFPEAGLKIDHFLLINPVKGASNDTLVNIDHLVVHFDAAAWWKHDEIKINELLFQDGTMTIFYDSLGNSNYSIFRTDTVTKSETSTKPFTASMENIKFEHVNFCYDDLSMKLKANLHDMTATINGNYTSGTFSSTIKMDQSFISLIYDGERYLDNVSSRLEIVSDISYPNLMIKIKSASASLNDIPIKLNGFFGEDSVTQNLIFGLVYNVDPSPVDRLQKMVPPSYESYFKGMNIMGELAIEGKINGTYNDSVMPVFYDRLIMKNGNLKYEGLPIQMHDINGDITLVTDGMTDSLTFVRIDQFEAKTAKSSFSTKGMVNHLFSDTYCDLTSKANLTLDEFKAMIPANMKVNIKGKLEGEVKSAFSMEQIKKMQIEKMKLSGVVSVADFDMTYDSLSLQTDESKIAFSLPNVKAPSKNTKFVYADIQAKNLATGKLNSYHAKLQKSHLILETSDIRDTTRIPDVICSFSMDSLSAGMDTIHLAIKRPSGRIMVFPRKENRNEPQIRLTGSTHRMEALMGKDTASFNQFHLNTEVINQKDQKDIFQQWLVKGSAGIEEGKISMQGFTYPFEIPAIELNFSPEILNIKEGKLKINHSDFQLSGNISNLLSYYRGDSILKGNLNFTSNNTDVLQLMTMTNGIGYEKENPDSVKPSDSSSGPYMVPKRIDIVLNTDIRKATIGTDTATNITGNVNIHDGILLLDDVKLTTPAARMQLTAMYRTPRKNHLFLGIDYHMMDIEIEQLLKMIPDIDTLMPMLRSFRGKGEFHLAVETYLDSTYNLKKSTLRGAASITGQDLVLMDGETFSEIAKTLKFNKKTENRVDSLSAEFTIFRNEIDIYPFLLVMDKYKAIVAGRHNFDMSFDYNISVVDCPLPIKLGVDVKGDMNNLKYSLTKCKYKELYRPTARHEVENKQLELRKMIREALTSKMKN